MVRRKNKGINAERELIHLFWDKKKWAAVRIAGSGAIKYPVPDVLAANNLRKVAIECKSTKNTNQYFRKDQVKGLQEFSRIFGTEAWLGIRFDQHGWYFMNVEDMKETPKGFSVNLERAEIKGLSFEELTGNF